MATCAECDFDWDCPADMAIGVIERFADGYRTRLRRFLDDPDRNLVRTRPAPEVWSALEYAAHIRDVIAFYAERIDRVLKQDRPQMKGVDFASLPQRAGYLHDDPDDVLHDVAVSSSSLAEVLRELTSEGWGRIGIGTDGDERTTLDLARRLAHDGQHHLLDLDRIADSLLAS